MKRFEFKLTNAERELLRALAGKSSAGELLRRLIHKEARLRGLTVPDDALKDTRGKYERKPPG
jgi:hypothetical protein